MVHSLAISISLYNRWDELQGLLELLRLHWRSRSDLFIAVTSTAKENEVPHWVHTSWIDSLEFGSLYTLPTRTSSFFRPLHDRRYGEFKRRLRARTVDCIQRGCIRCMQSGKKYTLHLHAAAWPLIENSVYDIIGEMIKRQAVAGARGYGKNLIDGKHPAGDIDDNFFFIDNAFAQTYSYWTIDPERDASVMGAEGQLCRRFEELGCYNKVYLYDDFSDEHAYLFPPGTSPRRVQPYNYHKRLGFLRSHDMRYQARLCRDMNIHIPFIDAFIQREGLKSIT